MVICVVGGDGSGKTTQIARLDSIFRGRDARSSRSPSGTRSSTRLSYRNSPSSVPSDIYAYLKLLGPVSRTHFLFHALHLALERARARQPNVLLLNAYWYKYFATEVAHGGDLSYCASWRRDFPSRTARSTSRSVRRTRWRARSQRSDYESGYGQDEQTIFVLSAAHARRARRPRGRYCPGPSSTAGRRQAKSQGPSSEQLEEGVHGHAREA